MNRGQVTIEALLIFGAFILIIFSISVPTVYNTEKHAKDVQFISDAKFASDRVATFASVISNPYEKRTAEVYVPGYTSLGNASDNKPIIWMATCISSSGSVLNTTVVVVRRDTDGTITTREVNTFSSDIGAGTWKTYINTGSGYQEGVIVEDRGGRYNITFSWENITSNTVPRYVLSNCSATVALVGG